MKVGIMEIMPQGHYTLVDSIARIYATDSKNKIFICTHENGAEIIKPLLEEINSDIKLVVKDLNESLTSYFYKINQLNLDILFITTLEKYFADFYNFNFNCNLSLFIHNIDAWFLLNLPPEFIILFFTLSSIPDI